LLTVMGQRFTILFVDDDHQVLVPVCELLKSFGYRVLTAGNALEAIRIVAQEHVDLLFTDIFMPDQDGIELAKQARELRPGIRILFATGYFPRAADAVLLGKVLFKPMRAHQIEDAIKDVLRREG
jgi:CheY-like chemotaxis protein